MRRDPYIDYVRGIASIGIVFIHTVWWSGTDYVPSWLRQASLLVDVPLFFFLAGWSYSQVKNVDKFFRNLLRLQMRYMFFLFLLALILIPFGHRPGIVLLLNWFLHNTIPDATPFVVLTGSVWFYKVYLLAGSAAVLAIRYLKRREILATMAALLGWMVYACAESPPVKDVNLWGVSLEVLSFYSWFFLFGYLSDRLFLSWSSLLLACSLLGGLLVGWRGLFHVDVLDLQHWKFPPTIPYLLASLFAVLLVVRLKSFAPVLARLPLRKPIETVGRNAIFFYFAQGYSSSILYSFLPHVRTRWWITLTALFVANVAMWAMIGTALRALEAWSVEGFVRARRWFDGLAERVA